MFTLESLQAQLQSYQKQFEAASSMMHQTAGAIQLLTTQIAQLQQKEVGEVAQSSCELSDKEYVDREMQVL